MNNYKLGAIKRKLKIKGDFKTGELISKANEVKIKNKKTVSKKLLAIMGMV